ncbi:MAG: 50S ribosome-binding GTPase [Clostridia bacterium]|nr:50S ribosome-binding GTPase [Clostridia bacterium]
MRRLELVFQKAKRNKSARGAVENKRVVLAGNPNAGKTTLFNSLTHSSLRTGNFHGVTTSAAEKTLNGVTYVDAPGLYALSAYSMEEVNAANEIEFADLIIDVADALTLENSLNLTRRLKDKGKPVILYVTKLNQLKKCGGRFDAEKLSEVLGMPVLTCTPKQLKKFIEEGAYVSAAQKTQAKTMQTVSLSSAYSAGREGLSRADKLFYNRYFALLFFICSIALMFFVAFHPVMIGAVLKGLTEKLICETLANAITSHMQSEAAISLISEGILGGAGSVLSFVPQLAVLYLFLTMLDESGITSALAFATDGLFEKVNLSGRAAFSLVSGFGCTAAAILTTRGYSTQSAQKRTIAVLPYIPCGAKLPVFLTFLAPLFKNPFPVITCFYFAGLFISLLFSLLLKGNGEGMLSEVTPVILPQFKAVGKKLCFYVKGFIIKVSGIIVLFCVVSWLLSHFSFAFRYVEADQSMLASISRVLTPLFKPMGVSDWRIAYAALCGFIAKENVAATVAMLLPMGAGLQLSSALAISTFILLCPACVSALSASVKEAGVKFTLKCFVAQTAIAFLGAYAVNLIFSLI